MGHSPEKGLLAWLRLQVVIDLPIVSFQMMEMAELTGVRQVSYGHPTLALVDPLEGHLAPRVGTEAAEIDERHRRDEVQLIDV